MNTTFGQRLKSVREQPVWIWVGKPSQAEGTVPAESPRQAQALEATVVHVKWILIRFCQRRDIDKCVLYKTSALADGLKEGWEKVKPESGRPVSGQKPSTLFLMRVFVFI